MRRILVGIVAVLVLAQMAAGLAWADFGISNFRMSDQAGGPKTSKFPTGIKTVYVMFDYKDANNMPVQVRVYDPRGQVIFQETKTYNGSGSETMSVQVGEGAVLGDGDYVSNIFQRQEMYLTESLEWTVGQPSSQPPVKETVVVIQKDASQPKAGEASGAAPVSQSSSVGGGLDLPVLGAGVLFVALIGLVVWAVRGFVQAGR